MYPLAVLIGLMTSVIFFSRWSTTFGYRQWLIVLLVTLAQVLFLSVVLMLMHEPVLSE